MYVKPTSYKLDGVGNGHVSFTLQPGLRHTEGWGFEVDKMKSCIPFLDDLIVLECVNDLSTC